MKQAGSHSGKAMSLAQAERYSGLSRYYLERAIAEQALSVINIPGTRYIKVLKSELDILLAPKGQPAARGRGGMPEIPLIL